MTTKEKYEGVLIWVMAFVFIGLACLGLWLLKTLTLLPIIALYTATILSSLYIKKFDLNRSKEEPTAFTVSALVVSAICCALVLFGNKKDRAIIESAIVSGKIEKSYYEYEYENGKTETKYNYVVKTQNKTG